MSDDCIFCKIVAGQIPCAKVLENERALAFLDIGPLAPGHVLLVPKQHFATIDQMPAEVAGGMMALLPQLVAAVRAATSSDGVNVLQNNGKAAHQEVPHVHVHIIPRRPGDAFHFNWPAGKYVGDEMNQMLSRIQQHLSR